MRPLFLCADFRKLCRGATQFLLAETRRPVSVCPTNYTLFAQHLEHCFKIQHGTSKQHCVKIKPRHSPKRDVGFLQSRNCAAPLQSVRNSLLCCKIAALFAVASLSV